MMDADVVALINSGATTLLGLMVTDAWDRVKGAATALFGTRSATEVSVIESDLEATRKQIKKATKSRDAGLEADLTAEWRNRLRRAVENDDHLLATLREFIEENKKYLHLDTDESSIKMSAKAYDKSRIYQQGHGYQQNS